MAWQMRNATPSSTVAPSQRSSFPRLLAMRCQCANVTVTPEVSSRMVLTAGKPQAPIGENCSMKEGPAEGQCEVKPGHTSAWLSRVARSGTEYTRAQKRAPKNAAKNITSEKMKKLIPQRNDTSSQRPYLPPSDSVITSPNQRTIMYSSSMNPAATETQPPVMPFMAKTPPSAMRKSDAEPMIGQAIGAGTE